MHLFVMFSRLDSKEDLFDAWLVFVCIYKYIVNFNGEQYEN
jgi:hypothetical protein